MRLNSLKHGFKPMLAIWIALLPAFAHAQTIDASSLAGYMNQIATYTQSIRDYLQVPDGTGTSEIALKNDPKTTTSGRAIIASSEGDGYGSSNASQYFSLSESQMCDQYGSKQARQLCAASRNALAANLKEIDDLLKSLEAHRTKLTDLLEKSKPDTAIKVQQMQYQLTALQTLMQNDMARIQLSIAAHQQKHALYQQQLATLGQQRLNGSGVGMSFKAP